MVRWTIRTIPRIIPAVLFLAITSLAVRAQSTLSGRAREALNMRSGPGPTYAVVTTLPAGAEVTLEQRTALGNWLYVRGADQEGWVATGYLWLSKDTDLGSLPVDVSLPDADPNAVLPDDEQALSAVPIMPVISDHVADIFKKGQKLGNNAHVVAKLGDCNSESSLFLAPLDAGNYDLGPYKSLQTAVDYFSGSFGEKSVAAQGGFTALSVLDSTWADPAVCQPNETPVSCEYRRLHPSVAIIMFGTNDLYSLNSDEYEQAVREIIQDSLDQGVIPVLSTFTSNPDKSDRWGNVMRFNRSLVALAKEFDIPIMNFWLAARSLPNDGVADDNAHLTASGGSLSLNGEETWSGFALRNLLALQTLDNIRRKITA